MTVSPPARGCKTLMRCCALRASMINQAIQQWLATGRASLARQVGGEKPDKEATHQPSSIAGG
jgi:hypothetical protein